jgi:threonine/homoserine/homoserine lactone efflux protein
VLPFLVSGLSLGLAAGLSPGPMLGLVISQTLRHGMREGVRVAFAPLLSDLPIVLLCLFALMKVSGLGAALSWIAIIGGLFVGYLGYESLSASRLELGSDRTAPRSIAKAVAVNMLNPHVYVFWATVGAPMLLKGMKRADGSAVAFVAGFYACLVGSKVLIAILAGRSRKALMGRGYQFVMRVLGVLLFALAVWMIAGGIAGL